MGGAEKRQKGYTEAQDYFDGRLDDARIYNRALSAESKSPVQSGETFKKRLQARNPARLGI